MDSVPPVVPGVSGVWNHRSSGVRGGSVAALVYRGRVVYAVVGDTGPADIIGEASYAAAQALGIDPHPTTGGAPSGITYVLFTGARAQPIESASTKWRTAVRRRPGSLPSSVRRSRARQVSVRRASAAGRGRAARRGGRRGRWSWHEPDGRWPGRPARPAIEDRARHGPGPGSGRPRVGGDLGSGRDEAPRATRKPGAGARSPPGPAHSTAPAGTSAP
ncbi:hypothetical protein EAO77_24035 [Streptomyces sp. t39]|nr:hypothetical protein EAO77_24035 [Streptomyces sp. t39]